MRGLRVLLAGAAVALAIAAPASAADRYASPAGTGPVASCLQNDPCSLADALDDASLADGDDVHLAAGTYTVTSAIYVSKAVDVLGSGAPPATKLDATTFTSNYPFWLQNGGASINDIEIDGASNFQQLFLHAGTANRVIVRNSSNNACATSNGVFANTLCVASGSGYSALAMNWSGGSHNVTIQNSTFIGGPGGYGIFASTSNSGDTMLDVASSIITGGAGGLYLSAGNTPTPSSTGMTATNSNYPTIDFAGAGATFGTTPGFGTNQTEAPVFVDAAAGDYAEASSSPTIDKGALDTHSGALDLAGLARVSGDAADIGAYEYAPPAPPSPPAGGGSTPAADTTAPKVTLTKAPKPSTTSRKAKISFRADEAATFRCRLDKGAWKPCRSPYKKTVKRGKHRLQIRATDAAGNLSSITTVRWKVTKKK